MSPIPIAANIISAKTIFMMHPPTKDITLL
jgi:hypothetical protein